jgi:hypothetical protein
MSATGGTVAILTPITIITTTGATLMATMIEEVSRREGAHLGGLEW